MSGSTLLFIVMAIPAFCFAALTVIVKNIVHAVISLILCLIAIVPIYIGLKADFIAAAQVAIYVGAISIMIIFAVMFIHDKPSKIISHLNRQTYLGVFVAMMLFGAFFFFIFNTRFDMMLKLSPISISSIEAVSRTMFGTPGAEGLANYFIPVQLASFVILGALIGAMEMAKKMEDEL